ncbi:MAG: UDP-N-acetylmuramoyl-L-alanyl-D-glutamate--2,6-diaminopimelate ligase, partial [Oscillospiraceae bacterium]|nr:UDP-N-acetylmuramoyl-L-alanyl-D-glutamate--2,6-diaminopimelate ligase [Oscillospiraceae bacterium]
MKLKELIKNLHITALHADPETEIAGISYDSRKTQPGDLFVAICGFTSDGHRFIPAATEKGAAVVLCERSPEQDIPYVMVEDARLGLALCSVAFYGEPAKEMRMIGITGTSGKTTVSTILKHVLEDNGKKVGLVGTNGIWIGQEEHPSSFTTPESLELQQLFRQMADA